MNIAQLANRKILLLGFGVEGQDTYAFLRGRFPEMQLAIADQRERTEFSEETQKIFTADSEIILHLGSSYLENLSAYEIIVRTPGIPLDCSEIQAAQKNGIVVTSATNIFFGTAQGTILAVTGSKGKSTTASLIAAILQEAGKDVMLIGNIGKPVLGYLAEDRPERIYVYEISSYQLEDLIIPPTIGLITTFFPAHLDHHGTEEAYFQAKMNLFRNMSPENVALYNPHFSRVAKFLESISCRKIVFADEKGSRVEEGSFIYQNEAIMPTAHLQLLGKHNQDNVLAAIATVKLFQVENDVIDRAVSKFRGLPHRLQLVGTFQGIQFYNDSFSTTPDSTVAAITTFGDQLATLIVGGFDSGFSYTELGQAIAGSSIRTLILFSSTGQTIATEVEGACRMKKVQPPVFLPAPDLQIAIQAAYENTPAGKVCLLSPAAQSFGLFKNYVDRGEQFTEAVRTFGNNL